MRLICPNCGAQYEVPDNVIPEAGRDVQCSNCGNTWFQHHPDDATAPVSEQEQIDQLDTQDPDPEPAPAPRRRELDPSITDVLREEAAREARARDADRGGLESQPDLGLAEPADEATRRANQARERMARMRGGSEETDPQDMAEDLEPSSRKDLLPDIEEINSSLRAATDRRPAEADDYATPASAMGAPEPEARNRGGFGRGFLIALILAALFWSLYIYAGPISAKLPQAEPYLSTYVAKVDQARAALNEQVQVWLVKLDAMSSESAG